MNNCACIHVYTNTSTHLYIYTSTNLQIYTSTHKLSLLSLLLQSHSHFLTVYMDYLNKDTIKEGASYINNKLLSKGYINDPIQFNSIDWDTLKQGQSQDFDLSLTDTVFQNDKTIINIIYGLLQSVDRNKDQHKSFNHITSQKDQEIKLLKDKVLELETKLVKLENKLETITFEKNHINKQLTKVIHQNKIQTRDLNKSKGWCNEIKTKYDIEMKKKNLTINNLKDQLIDRKNVSTTITYGIRTDVDIDTNANSEYIYNNNPIINNLNDTNLPVPILNSEYEKIVITLTDLTNNLIKENHKFSRFIKNLNKYYGEFNRVINPDVDSQNDQFIPNPEDFFNLQNLNKIDDLEIDIDNIETFEFVIKPIFNNIYKNYHYLNNLFDEINLIKENQDNYDKQEIETLQRELEQVTENWRNALSRIEEMGKISQSDQ